MKRWFGIAVVVIWCSFASLARAQVEFRRERVDFRVPREAIGMHIDSLPRMREPQPITPTRLDPEPRHSWLAHDGNLVSVGHPRLLEKMRHLDPLMFEGPVGANDLHAHFSNKLSDLERIKRFDAAVEKLSPDWKLPLHVFKPDPAATAWRDGIFHAWIQRYGHPPIRVSVAKSDKDVATIRKLDPDALIVVEKTGHPFAGLRALDKEVDHIRVFDGLARTPEEFQAAHNDKGGDKDLSIPKSFSEALGEDLEHLEIDPEATPANGRQIAARVRGALLHQKPGEWTAVLAHVEYGVAWFIDGSFIETSFIAQQNGILIGCQTESKMSLVSDIHLVTTRDLSFATSRLMAQELVEATRSGTTKTLGEMLRTVQKRWNARSKIPATKFIVELETRFGWIQVPS